MDEEMKKRHLLQTVVFTVVTSLIGIGLLVLANRANGMNADAGDDRGAPFRKLAWLIFATAGFVLTVRLVAWRGLSLRWIGSSVGLLLLGVVVASNFDESVLAFQRQAFGEYLFGQPVLWVVIAAQVLLLGPAFLSLGSSLFVIASEALRQGRGGQGGMLTLLIVGRKLPESLQRDRRRIFFIGGYLLCLFIAWIVYTARRGI
jgi:hypothetical protein